MNRIDMNLVSASGQACYEVQKPGTEWFSVTPNFKNYESFRAVVPVLPLSNYAWKISGWSLTSIRISM